MASLSSILALGTALALSVVYPAAALTGKVTGEYTLSSDTGGSWQSSTLLSADDGFCFLTTMTQLDGSNEGCHITIGEIVGHSGNFWILNQKSNNDDGNTVCGARCFVTTNSNAVDVSGETTISTETGGSWTKAELGAPSNTTFCGMTQATRLDGDNEGCWLTWEETVGRTGYWWDLQEKSNNGGGSTACSARCVQVPGTTDLQPYGWTQLDADTGGSWESTTLYSSATSMCYLVAATQLDGDNEGCSIVETEVVGRTGYFWVLRQKSNNDSGNTVCGAACFSYSSSDRSVPPQPDSVRAGTPSLRKGQ